VVAKTLEGASGQSPLAHPEYFTIPLPSSIDPASPDKPTSFCTTNSRPSVLKGIDKGSEGELLHTVVEMINRDFNIPVCTGQQLVSASIDSGVQDNIKRIVLVGASNLKAVAGLLMAEGYEVTDYTVPGWTVSPENVAMLVNRLKTVSKCNNMAYILDLFGNSCTRVGLFDGTTTLPTRGGDGYHLLGEIRVCDDVVFAKLVDAVMPIFELIGEIPQVIIPPQPRYLFRGCCDDPLHSRNVSEKDHAENILAANFKLRATLKKKLNGKIVGPYRIVDTCNSVVEPAGKSLSTRLSDLQASMSRDGVHLTKTGYANVVLNLTAAVCKLQSGQTDQQAAGNVQNTAALSVSGCRYHWRGISSPNGSKAHQQSHHWSKWARGKSHMNSGPYSYRGWRGGRRN